MWFFVKLRTLLRIFYFHSFGGYGVDFQVYSIISGLNFCAKIAHFCVRKKINMNVTSLDRFTHITPPVSLPPQP